MKTIRILMALSIVILAYVPGLALQRIAGINKTHIDTTASFVFGYSYLITSGDADSMVMTRGSIETAIGETVSVHWVDWITNDYPGDTVKWLWDSIGIFGPIIYDMAGDSANWNTAYNWGDHGAQNYLDDDVADDVDDADIDWGTGAGQVAIYDIPGTAWRLYYTDGSGVFTGLALGSSGTYLKSNGASSAPSWDTPGGAGDVTNVIGGNGLFDDGDTGDITLDIDSAWVDAFVDTSDTRYSDSTNRQFIGNAIGFMLVGNTETRIAVDYQSGDNTIDFVVDDMNDDAPDDDSEVPDNITINPINATTEGAIESAIELQDCQGAVTDAQVPDNITIIYADSAGHVTDGTIDEPDLQVTNAPSDNYILSYDLATLGFTWVEDATGGGELTIEEGDVEVDATVTTIDFGPGFDVTESPEDEVNIVLDYTEDPVDLATAEITGILPIVHGGTGANALDDIVQGSGITVTDGADAIIGGNVTIAHTAHTGEVTGATGLTIADDIIEAINLESTDSPNDGEIPTYDVGSGGFTWEADIDIDSIFSSAQINRLLQLGYDVDSAGKIVIYSADGSDSLTITVDGITTTKDYQAAHLDTVQTDVLYIMDSVMFPTGVSAAHDDYVLAFDDAGDSLYWKEDATGASTFIVKEDDISVDATVTTLDFGAGFDLTESPEDEINIVLDYTEDPINLATAEVAGILPESHGGTGDSDLDDIVGGEGITVTGGSNAIIDGNATIGITWTWLWGFIDTTISPIPHAQFADSADMLTHDRIMDYHLGDDDWGEIVINSNVASIDEDVIVKANFGDEDWGDITVASNNVTIDERTSAAWAADVSDETGTGVWVFNTDPSFSGALGLPSNATTAVNAEGEIDWENDLDLLWVYDGSNARIIAKKTDEKAFVIISPTAAHDFPMIQFKNAITITSVSAVCTGGTNVIGALQEYNATGTSVDAAIDGDWTITTSEYVDASFTNASIDAGDWLGWKTTSVSGSVTSLSLTFEYEEHQ